jgi:hypothetical protein
LSQSLQAWTDWPPDCEGNEMKNIAEFMKSTLIGGLFVLLPLVLFYLILAEILEPGHKWSVPKKTETIHQSQ